MNMKEGLFALSGVSAPSGFEGAAAQLAVDLLSPYMDEVSIDKMGSVIGVKYCGKPNAKRVLLDAHLDEIGLIVTGVEDGFLRFQALGGVDSRMLPDRELTIMTEPPIYGVVACMAPHVLSPEEAKQSIPITNLYVDIGMSQEDAEQSVPIGTPMVFRGGCDTVGENYVCGKAMDDRAGFMALVGVAEQLKDTVLDVDLYILGSTQEETHGIGAKGATFAIAPHCCIAVDVTHGKTPDAGSGDNTFEMGGGPVIGLGPNMSRWISNRFVAKAEEKEIPHQIEVMAGHTGTNGWYMQISREGIATGVLSLPLRYMHSPIETLHWGDFQQTVQLLSAFVEGLGEEGWHD